VRGSALQSHSGDNPGTSPKIHGNVIESNAMSNVMKLAWEHWIGAINSEKETRIGFGFRSLRFRDLRFRDLRFRGKMRH